MSALADAEAVRAAVMAVAHHIDAKRWPELRALYAEVVATDYTSLFGGDPTTASADELVAGWRGALATVNTQHLLGPIDVVLEGDRAEARCHVRGAHYHDGAPGGDAWEVLGHYVFALERRGSRFAITSMTLQAIRQTGNTRLLEEAKGTCPA